MPIKLNLVFNRGQVLRPVVKTNNSLLQTQTFKTQQQQTTPQGISLRRAINAHKTGCKSCGG